MALSNELISQFAKIVTKDKKRSSESTVYGIVVEDGNGNKYVKLDGSDQLTPLSNNERPSADLTLVDAKEGERVSVLIKDHTATVTGNVSSPAVRTGDFNDLSDQVAYIKEFDMIIAGRIQANEGYIKDLQADHVSVGELDAANAKITELESSKVSTEELTATKAEITDLIASKINADVVSSTYATIESLETVDAKIDNLEARHGTFETLTTGTLDAHKASIDNLEADKLSATDADLKYANIDFANIDMAAIQKFFSVSGIIKDLVVGDTSITGELVGVTIKGDLIEGGTVKADKLVVKGDDGLYYKLNTDGVTTELEQTEYNSLNGSVITAKSITATKINVDDLVAFDATIGGYNITSDSLYSGTKTSVDNTTRGVYFDSTGQMAIGDANNFIKYYKDQNGNYKLEISADSVSIRGGDSGGSAKLEDVIDEIKNNVDSLRDEITTLLRIESSRGTVFKNDQVATVLSVVIYHGTKRITDNETMKSIFGNGAHLQWKWQRLDDSSFGVLSSSDSRFGDEGFTFTLSPEDVDTKVTFMCELII